MKLRFSITYLNDILRGMKLDFLTKRKQIFDVQVSIVVSQKDNRVDLAGHEKFPSVSYIQSPAHRPEKTLTLIIRFHASTDSIYHGWTKDITLE